MSFMFVSKILNPISKLTLRRYSSKLLYRDIVKESISKYQICLFSSGYDKEKENKKAKLHFDGNNFRFRMLFTIDFYVCIQNILIYREYQHSSYFAKYTV